jgi:hypothetical protein
LTRRAGSRDREVAPHLGRTARCLGQGTGRGAGEGAGWSEEISVGWIEWMTVGMGERREIPEDEGEKGWNL